MEVVRQWWPWGEESMLALGIDVCLCLSVLVQRTNRRLEVKHYPTMLWLDALRVEPKLPASVYDILPPTSAIIGYALGLWKLSANCQIFQYATTRTAGIVPGHISLITIHSTCACTNKIVEINMEWFFYPRCWAQCLHVCCDVMCFHSLSTQTFSEYYQEWWYYKT